MNRFGIRLAAGLAVITLGTLAILQARSGKEAALEEPWPETVAASATEPPAPLGIEEDTWPDLPDDSATLVRGNNRTSAADPEADAAAAGPSSSFAMGNVQLASHDEPATAPPAAAPGGDFGFPEPLPNEDDLESEDAPSADVSADEVPSFGMPSAAPEMPAKNTLRGELTFGATESQPVGSSLQMPTLHSALPAADVPQEIAEQEAPEQNPAEQSAPEYATLEDGIPEDGATEAAAATSAPWGSDSLAPLPNTAAATPEPSDELETQQAELTGTDDSQRQFEAEAGDDESFDAGAFDGGHEFGTIAGDSFAPQASEPNPAAMAPLDAPPSQGSSANATLQTVQPSEVLAQPGERRLEGAQTPSVVIHKRAPEEVRVGKAAEFVIQVKNVGTVAALDVRIFDSVPEGMELVATVPSATETENMLSWQLGDLEPGGERTVTMKLIPRSEGELGSVARVTFEAAASVRTVATRPQLKLVQRAPEQVLIGQQVEIEVELSNTGSGTATGVMLQADLADGLEHPMGRQLDNLIGDMPPGDLRRQILRLRATKPGRVKNTIRLTGEDGVATESTVEIETISPALEVALSGPSLRYLERQTTYNVQIGNSGTANAADVDVVAYLDRGLKFVSTEFEGQYDPNHHAVFWSLAELPVGQKGEVPLTLLPVEAGIQNVRLEAKAELGITARSEKELAIETLAELSFSIADDQDPIETGTEATYEVQVQNAGSRDDTNVQLKVQLPPGMELVSADPQAGTDGRGLVVFQPIATLAAKGEQKFRVRVRGTSADTHVIQAMLTSDQSRKPVTKEESTTVYADR